MFMAIYRRPGLTFDLVRRTLSIVLFSMTVIPSILNPIRSPVRRRCNMVICSLHKATTTSTFPTRAHNIALHNMLNTDQGLEAVASSSEGIELRYYVR
jgi:hypothetical protein